MFCFPDFNTWILKFKFLITNNQCFIIKSYGIYFQTFFSSVIEYTKTGRNMLKQTLLLKKKIPGLSPLAEDNPWSGRKIAKSKIKADFQLQNMTRTSMMLEWCQSPQWEAGNLTHIGLPSEREGEQSWNSIAIGKIGSSRCFSFSDA